MERKRGRPSNPSPRAWARGIALAVLAGGSFSCGGGGGGGGGAINPAYDLASVTPSPQAAAVDSEAGSFAADYLRATNFTRLVVEVDYPASRPPSPASLELLRDRLEERCDKPDGVVVVADDAIPDVEMNPIMSLERVQAIEDEWRGTFSDAATKTAAMYVLYVTGHSELDEGAAMILGLSHRGGSFVIFIDRAEQGDDLLVTTAEMEGAGLVHESGHLLGLVNGGVPMTSNHADSQSIFHDADPTTIMYRIVQVPTTMPNIGDEDFAQFNKACVDDLQAFGGLGPWPGMPVPPGSALHVQSRPPTEYVAVGLCPCGLARGPCRGP